MTAFRWFVALGLAFIIGGTGYALRPVECHRPHADPGPSTESLVAAAVQGCNEALGLVAVGVEDGVVVVKCRPSLGVVR